jgi:type IV pilus assembly protein PilE
MPKARRHAGFTLLEVMITVAIVGILAAIALPSYDYFITRSRIIEATTALGDISSQMEKYYMDNRRYDSAGACGVTALTVDPIASFNGNPSRTFDISCPAGGLSATTYVLQADGIGPMSGFQYTINEQKVKATGATPWAVTSANCWINRKDGTCL